MEETQEKVSQAESTSELSHNAQPEPTGLYIWHGFLDGLLAVLGKVFGFILDIFISLWNIIKGVGLGIYKGCIAFVQGVKSLCHKFRYNDIWGRLSFVFFGLGSLAHRQIVNGILYLGFEIGYIVAFILNGANSIRLLASLGEKTAQEVNCTDDLIFGKTCDTIPGDNSVLIMIQGILWVISIFLFLFIWKKSIEAGYNNYRIDKFDNFNSYIETAIPTSKEVFAAIEEQKLYETSLKETKASFKDDYASLSKLYDNAEGKHYGCYLLDKTIEGQFSYYAKLAKTTAKKEKLVAKLQAYDNKPSYVNFKSARNEKIASYYEQSKAAEEAGDLSKMKSFRIKALDLENTVAVITNKHNARAEKIKEKIREVSAQIIDLNKAHMAFADADSATNHTKYGKYNN